MKHLIFALLAIMIFASACENQTTTTMKENPFFTEWNTPFGVPPFDLIESDDYLPAFNKAFEQHDAEIEAIISNNEAPTFDNTIVSLDQSGESLKRVDNVFSNLNSANTSEELQKIAKEVSPLKSTHADNIKLNEALFDPCKSGL